MRAWVCALFVCLSLGCSDGGSQSDGGGGHAAGVGGGQAAGVGGGQAAGVGGGQAAGVGGQAGGGTSGRGGMAGAAGAGGQAGMPPTGGRGGSSDGITFCAGLSGATFMSLDALECGRGPDGGALCRWRINFTTATMFTWQHSDFAESGTYTCDGNTITAQRQTGGPITATYDRATQRLTWDGIDYCTSCTSI